MNHAAFAGSTIARIRCLFAYDPACGNSRPNRPPTFSLSDVPVAGIAAKSHRRWVFPSVAGNCRPPCHSIPRTRRQAATTLRTRAEEAGGGHAPGRTSPAFTRSSGSKRDFSSQNRAQRSSPQ